MTVGTLVDSARRIAQLAWPVFIGQLAVLAFSTVDTVLVARHAALDLAALAVGSVPLAIYASAIWGVGLVGGYLIAFDSFSITPPALLGARGFWAAATAGLVVAGVGMSLFLAWVLKQQRAAG